MLIYLILARPFRYLSNLIIVLSCEAFIIITHGLAHAYHSQKPTDPTTLTALDLSFMVLPLIGSVFFLIHQLYDTWTSLLLWKASRDGHALNPFHLTANFSQAGNHKMRDAAYKL